MQELYIKVPGTTETSYRITIGSGLLSSVWSTVEAGFPKAKRFIITDANVVAAGHLDTLLQGRDAPSYVIRPAGEPSKNIGTAVAIVEAMEKAYLGRDTVVLALGGGTVGDIAGFAAAIFKRGVPVVQIPTTTLAQADSAIGGKTGVDSSISKNAFGAFWHPAAVFIDVATLRTLDERQYRAGLVESVKHGLIAERGVLRVHREPSGRDPRHETRASWRRWPGTTARSRAAWSRRTRWRRTNAGFSTTATRSDTRSRPPATTPCSTARRSPSASWPPD